MPALPIQLLPCTSSRIREFGYDPTSKTLYLRFHGKNGDKTIYAYNEVPLETYEGLVSVSVDPEGSVGKYFGASIKEKFSFAKLVDDEPEAAKVAA